MTKSTSEFLNSSGQMHGLIADKDWSKTPLGPVEHWDDALRLAVSLCLNSRFPLILWWGPELTMLYNDPYCEHLQSKHPSALGRPGNEVWSEIWTIIGPMLDGVLQTGKATWNDDMQLFLNRNGFLEETYHTFSYSAAHDRDGKIVGIFTPVSETTERVLSARRLKILGEIGATRSATERELCEQIQKILESSTLDLPCCDLFSVQQDTKAIRWLAGDGRIKNAMNVDGSPLSDSISKALEEQHWKPIERFDEMVSDVSLSQHGLKPHTGIIVPVLLRAGEWLIVASATSPHRPLTTPYIEFFEELGRVLASTIKETRALEDEKNRAEALLELDKAKTAFFNNISHEFRTPLTLMLGPIEQATASRQSIEIEDVDLLQRNAQRLLKLVNTLLDFSRIEAGRYGASFAPVDIAALTTDIASSFRSAIESAGIKFNVDCESVSSQVFVDPDLWEKIVLNLLSNAFKYTLEGSISLRLIEDAEGVSLEVVDTGCGISTEDLPKIFERFQRLKDSKGRSQEGSGIGLALVRELIKIHGGSIDVDSKLNKGTTFKVRLLKGTQHLPSEQISVAPPVENRLRAAESYINEALSWQPHEDNEVQTETSGQRYRVLVVDDNADMRMYFKRLLQPFYDIETANNGREAKEKISQSIPHLVITDVMMPELDGFGLLSELHSDKRTARIPVMVVSARAGEEARLEGLSKGADDYLVKPFSAKELLAKVNLLIQSSAISTSLHSLIDSRTAELQELSSIISDFVDDGDFCLASKRILRRTLAISGAEYGFIGATVPGGPQGRILRVFADLGFDWSSTENRDLYEKIIADYETKGHIDFPMLDNLFGWPIKQSKTIITNDPANDERRSGRQPKGHPPMHNFMGVPIFKGTTVVGTLGIANKPGGFTEEDEKNLAHLMKAASVIFESYRRLQNENRILKDRSIAEENLIRANEALMELAYSVSHELQEPLAALRGDLSLLAARYRDRLGTDADQFIASALESNNSIRGMIDDLWLYARIDRPHLTFDETDMNELFDKTINALESQIEEKGAAIKRGDLPKVRGEQKQLAILLEKLLLNSLTFCKGRPEANFTAERMVDEWQFCVQDNGIGFEQTEAHEIFKMFRKLNRELGGTGMGLSIAKRIVEFHGGRIWAEGEPRRGAKFFFTLPLVAVR